MLSAAEVLSPPLVEPIMLATVKTYLRIDGSALDDELNLMIAAAREDLELLTGLRLVNQTVRVIADEPIDLDHLTVGKVRELVAIGTVQPGGAIEPASIAAFDLTGADLARGIAPLGNWPTSFFKRPIAVDLAVGYGPDGSAVPASLRLALLALIRGRYDDQPADVERLIFNYRLNS
ncbi:phage head-tail connector protein [Sphingomonas sanguinis]|uniref:head-tail connector protein n=1 Tax=Sphingomonas sanguinis TaxID=33051 RepID=UPI001C56D3F8|nr:phage head-tail connector protein [Sphingomonas sanguinis]QXT34333.1 phage head-tail connector protein [Sphingomonas sanguinis]